jgi:hypothetical protein
MERVRDVPLRSMSAMEGIEGTRISTGGSLRGDGSGTNFGTVAADITDGMVDLEPIEDSEVIEDTEVVEIRGSLRNCCLGIKLSFEALRV